MSVLLAVTACAHSSGHAVNVHSVRVSIKEQIGGDRTIVSMGKVTEASAVVYTDSSGGRAEETWIKGPSGWALQESHKVAAAQ